LLGRFAILCAILRQLHLILHIALFTTELDALSPSAFFVDQLSAGLPVLKALSPVPIFFYCHFPDLLLARGRAHWWKRLYRLPFDALEQWSMSFADAIAVNSSFTKSIVSHTWPSLAAKQNLHVVYPCIAIPSSSPSLPTSGPLPWASHSLILSINRFERKKDISLALRAFAALPSSLRSKAKLLLAGGYDPRVPENVAYHSELVSLAEETLQLRTATATNLVSALSPAHADAEVLFLLSVPNKLKEVLLSSAKLLVYTPSNEHFGIVPLEAMLHKVPVLAANNGGPTETVVDGVTGWLRDPEDVKAWTEVMGKVLGGMKKGELEEMGRRGRERVEGRFAEGQMAERLDGIFEGMVGGVKRRKTLKSLVGDVLLGMVAVAIVGGLIATVVGLMRVLGEMSREGRMKKEEL
jgi:alpha-1,3/alpha-1,6-mannosyltransferase